MGKTAKVQWRQWWASKSKSAVCYKAMWPVWIVKLY